MKHLTFVTGNRNKFQEISDIFAKEIPEIELLQSNEPLLELQAETLEVVAKFKVQSVQDNIHGEFFIEDAGFFVDDHLHGFPGVYSSYVMKTVGYDAILRILGDKTPKHAHFESVIAFYDQNKHIHLFKGENAGTVSNAARGTSGFGFDPIFISNDYPTKTFAQLTLEEKNQISHRSRAIQKMISFLKVRKN